MVRFPPPKSHDKFCPPPLRIPNYKNKGPEETSQSQNAENAENADTKMRKMQKVRLTGFNVTGLVAQCSATPATVAATPPCSATPFQTQVSVRHLPGNGGGRCDTKIFRGCSATPVLHLQNAIKSRKSAATRVARQGLPAIVCNQGNRLFVPFSAALSKCTAVLTTFAGV